MEIQRNNVRNTYREIEQRVETLREAQNLTQSQVAQGIGMKDPTYRKKESGNGSNFNPADIIDLASFFGTDCHFLLTGASAEHLTIQRELGFGDSTIKGIQGLEDKERQVLVFMLEDKCFKLALSFIYDAISTTLEKAPRSEKGKAVEAIVPAKKGFTLVSNEIAADLLWSKALESLKTIGKNIVKKVEAEVNEYGND